MAVGDIGGLGPTARPAEVRPPPGQLALTDARTLPAALALGEVVTARVGQDLGNGNVTLTLRGQTLVANSATTLQPDSLVKLVVQSVGDQPVMRIITVAPQTPGFSTPQSRAAALGLPATPVALTALAAFEAASAPLDLPRLKEAVAQLQNLPAAQVPQRAQALALLAQAGLPTTPPFIALAERSASGVLPNPAAAVAEVQRLAQAAGITLRPPDAPAGTSPAVGGGQPTVGTATTLVGPGATVVPGAAPPLVANPSATVANPVVAGQQPVIGNQPPAAGQPPATSTVPTNAPAGAPAPEAQPTAPPPAARGAPAVSTQIVPAPLPSAPAPVLTPGAPVPASAAPAAALALPLIPVVHTLAGTPVPDLARGGATAVLQALALAGVRPRDTSEVHLPKPEPTLLHRLDLPVEEVDASRASLDSTMRHPQQPALEAAVVQVMREQAAETVIKPQSLKDYDLVFGLPLQVNGQPLPARLAVAERQTSAGTATFLRVDAELSALGPLSVRISGIENGPMAITVLAAGPALTALSDALPDLVESLRALGLAAGVRIADLVEDLTYG